MCYEIFPRGVDTKKNTNKEMRDLFKDADETAEIKSWRLRHVFRKDNRPTWKKTQRRPKTK